MIMMMFYMVKAKRESFSKKARGRLVVKNDHLVSFADVVSCINSIYACVS